MPKIYGQRDTPWGPQPQFTADQPYLGPEMWFCGAGWRWSKPIPLPDLKLWAVVVFRIFLNLERDEHYLQEEKIFMGRSAAKVENDAIQWAYSYSEREADAMSRFG